MNESEKIWTASVAIGKNMDYETLLYSDYMYGHMELIDDVWEYVTECQEDGMNSFREKYKEHKLYF